MIANAPDRGGLGSSEDLLATVLEFLMTAQGDNPVLAALHAVDQANKPMRSAGRTRIGAGQRVARALDSSASVRAAHARLRQAIAANPVLGREP